MQKLAGESIILDAINTAHHSIWLEMYLLADISIIQALENIAHHQIDVGVMLEPTPYSGDSTQDILDKLNLAGVVLNTNSPSYNLTHENGMVIDGNKRRYNRIDVFRTKRRIFINFLRY